MTRLRLGLALAGVFCASLALAQAGDPRRSGYQEMGPALQKMQDDDTANPAMLFVQAGATAWAEKAGAADKSCADCHGDAAVSMRGVAARYPAVVPAPDRAVDLDGRINLCRTIHQQAPALEPEGNDLLALGAFVALQSRGQPIAPPDDPRLAAARAEGGGSLQAPPGSAQSLLRQLPRRQRRPQTRRRDHPAGPSDRLSDLSAGMAGAGIS